MIAAQCDTLFSPCDKSEKRVRSSAVKLLVHLRFGGDEAHHRHELCEELSAEMPPCVPDEIFCRRRQAADWCSFQFRIELVHNDERLCSSRTLLEDPKRIATMEKHCCHDSNVEFS